MSSTWRVIVRFPCIPHRLAVACSGESDRRFSRTAATWFRPRQSFASVATKLVVPACMVVKQHGAALDEFAPKRIRPGRLLSRVQLCSKGALIWDVYEGLYRELYNSSRTVLETTFGDAWA